MKTIIIVAVICLQFMILIFEVGTNRIVSEHHPIKYQRDYQINLTEDSIYIFDDLRHVGTIPYTDDSGLGKIIEDDNE